MTPRGQVLQPCLFSGTSGFFRIITGVPEGTVRGKRERRDKERGVDTERKRNCERGGQTERERETGGKELARFAASLLNLTAGREHPSIHPPIPSHPTPETAVQLQILTSLIDFSVKEYDFAAFKRVTPNSLGQKGNISEYLQEFFITKP
ncbi:hypothetical protein MJT46_011111, partial [Ovis ammon polii x Ovis aries]